MMSNERTVLITGASAGIGKATAALLAQQGFRVFGTSRQPVRDNNDFPMIQLDVASEQSVASCVTAVIRQAGRLDVLVNNAGIGLLGALEETSFVEAKALFETNFFGMVRMVNAVLPEMRERKKGLIVNIGSLAVNFAIPFHGYLTASKAAVNCYSDVLRLEVQPFGIRVALVEPGMVRTHLDDQWAKLKVASALPDYAPVENEVLLKLEEASRKSSDPQAVAKAILNVIQSRSPASHYLVGKERWYVLLNRILPAPVMESVIRNRLGLGG
jgi:NAD(P)-dependent dehydrogenase (short-subunit alcohol dehydrogenase family)